MGTLPSDALLLVGFLPSVRDLEIARMLGWYRIPLKSAPKIIEVDYIAFYQGASYGEQHRWQIEYVTEYRGHELTTRGELLRDEVNHPRAKEEYYKVQLGPLLHLDRPIMAGAWKRITFLYTTGELFNSAALINDLVVRSENREILWKNLRERSQQSSIYRTSGPLNPVIDPALLDLILGLNSTTAESDMEDY